MQLLDWLDYRFFDNSVASWGISAAVFLASWFVLALIRGVIERRLRSLSDFTKSTAVQTAEAMLVRTRIWFRLIVSVFLASRFVTLPPSFENIFSRVTIIALVVQAGVWASAGIGRYVTHGRSRQLEEDPGTVAALDVLGFVMRLVVWAIVLLLILDNVGVNITALVAGLGVGGIAVALAAQKILGDLFASLSIVLDKPFVVGDFLIVDDMLGNVEKVGLKSTRIRSLSGEQLILSNNDLLGSRIRNYGRMAERRAPFHLGVTYQTPADKLRRIPDIVRKIIDDEEGARFDRAHFQKYGDFALIFEIIYWVTSGDYARYMDIQQSINLQIYERFEEEGIGFAYPTQTVYVSKQARDPAAPVA